MEHFNYQAGSLFVEQVPVKKIIAAVGTPCYIYSSAAITQHYQSFAKALDHRPHKICYAVKANSNLAILNLLAQQGSGFDIVSQGELARVLAAKGNPEKTVYSGVGKQADEIAFALNHNIFCFNVESLEELLNIQYIAQHLGKIAPIALRVNPNIDAKSHPYIVTGLNESKFGIPYEQALSLYEKASQLSHISIKGLAYHIGSQIVEMAPFIDALKRMNELIASLQKKHITLSHLDIGGGLGVSYQNETPPSITHFIECILAHCAYPDLNLIIEPGRAVVANAGILATKILYLKESPHKNFCIVDAGMNDLLRPALYSAWQDIIPINQNAGALAPSKHYDIVGPVCESGDFIGKNRALNIIAGDYLAVCSAGAYGFSMSSNYNSRPRPAEVLVKNHSFQIIRQRETITDLYQHERIWQP